MDVDGQAQAKDPYALSQEVAYRVMKSTMSADVEADAIKVGTHCERRGGLLDCMGSDAPCRHRAQCCLPAHAQAAAARA